MLIRRREYKFIAFFLVFISVVALIALDYSLLVGNPEELRRQVQQLLNETLGQYDPRFEDIELDLPRNARLSQFSLRDPKTKEVIFRARELELRFGWFGSRDVIVHGAFVSMEADLRIEGREPSEPTKLPDIDLSWIPAHVDISFFDGDFQLKDTHTGAEHHFSLDRIQADVRDGLQVTGSASLRYGLFVRPGHPDFDKAQVYRDDDPQQRRRLTVIDHINAEFDRRRQGDFYLRCDVDKLNVLPALEGAVPPYIRDTVWKELKPSGKIFAHVDLSVKNGELDYTVGMKAHNCGIMLDGFPYQIRGIYGDFHIKNEVITWENTIGQANGAGRILGRGSVFLGKAHEKVTIYSFTRFSDVPIDEDMYAAVKGADDGAYKAFQMFQPVGTGTGTLIVARTPLGGSPQVSIEVENINGQMSATYNEVPIPAQNFYGSFRLMEGGGVKIDNGQFTIPGGGQATVTARLFKDELIYLDIRARDVEVTPSLLGKMPKAVQDYVEPLAVQSGRCHARVLVKKAVPNDKASPQVELELVDLRLVPLDLGMPIEVSGSVGVELQYPPGTVDMEVEPENIHLELNCYCESVNDDTLRGVRVRGPIDLDPRDSKPSDGRVGDAQSAPADDFRAQLMIDAEEVVLGRPLKRDYPPPIDSIMAQFQPRGRLKNLSLRLNGLKDISLRAEASSLTAVYEAFPLRVEPDTLSLRVRDGQVRLNKVTGRVPGGGRFQVTGEVILPDQDIGREATVDLSVQTQALAITKALTESLPASLQKTIRQLKPRGRVSSQLRVLMAPGIGELNAAGERDPLISGSLQLEGLSADVMGLLPEPERFTKRRLEELRGQIELAPDGVVIDGLAGSFFDVRVATSGRVDLSGTKPDMSFVVRLDDLLVSSKLAQEVPAAVKPILEDYDPRGTVDLELLLKTRKDAKGKPSDDLEMAVRVRPKDLAVRAKSLKVSGTDIRGLIELEGSQLTLLDVDARLGRAPVHIRRSVLDEGQGPADSQRFLIDLVGFDFEKSAVERLPPALQTVINGLQPKGESSVTSVFHVPGESAPVKDVLFLSDVFLKKSTLEVGMTLDKVDAQVSLSGRLGKSVSMRGQIQMDKGSWLKQDISQLSSRLDFRQEVLRLRGLKADLYGGELLGFVRFRVPDQSFRARFDLRELAFSRVVEGLKKLGQKDDASKDNKSVPNEPDNRPLTGRINGFVALAGSNQGAGRKSGYGELILTNSNVIPVPLIFRLTQLLSQEGKRVSSFDRITLRYHFEGRNAFESVVIDRGLLQSETLDLECAGRIWIQGPRVGEADLMFLPLDPTDKIESVQWLTRLLKYQITSIRATGKLNDPSVSWVPLRGFFDVLEVFGQKSAELFDTEGTGSKPKAPAKKQRSKREPEKHRKKKAKPGK